MNLALSLLLLAGFSPQAKGGLSAWDTGKSSPAPLNLEARDGWTAAAEGPRSRATRS